MTTGACYVSSAAKQACARGTAGCALVHPRTGLPPASPGEAWEVDVTGMGHVPWADDHPLSVIDLRWVARDGSVVEGVVRAPKGSKTKSPLKTTLPACRLVARVEV